MTEEKMKAIVDAAREWSVERQPKDPSSIRLFLAIHAAFPEDFVGKEACTCGEIDDCDECPTQAAVDLAIENLKQRLEPYPG